MTRLLITSVLLTALITFMFTYYLCEYNQNKHVSELELTLVDAIFTLQKSHNLLDRAILVADVSLDINDHLREKLNNCNFNKKIEL